jgi:hypothetical protein
LDLAAARARVTGGDTPSATARLQAPGLRAVLRELEHLLAISDAAALTLFEAHADELARALGEPGDLLAYQVRQFAFDRALETLRRLRPRGV